MTTFTCQIGRLLPETVNGEFVKDGLILYDKEQKDLLRRGIHAGTSVHAVFPEVAGRSLLNHLKELEHRIANVEKQIKTELQFEHLDNLDVITKIIMPKDDSALYFTETKSIIDVDANAALADLFERLVNAHVHHDEFHRFDDREVWSQVYRKYFEKHGVAKNLVQHTIKTASDQFKF